MLAKELAFGTGGDEVDVVNYYSARKDVKLGENGALVSGKIPLVFTHVFSRQLFSTEERVYSIQIHFQVLGTANLRCEKNSRI